MANAKVLETLLNVTNSTLENSNFNPLINQKTVDRVANNLCKVLSVTSGNENSILKANLRKSIVGLAQQLCRNKHTKTILNQSKESHTDIIAKYCTAISKRLNSKQSRRQDLYDELDLHGIQNLHLRNFNKVPKPVAVNLELAATLINYHSEQSKQYIHLAIKTCLKCNLDVDECIFEFLRNVWYSEKMVVSLVTFDLLTHCLIPLIETNFLNAACNLLEEKSSIDNFKLNTILQNQFPNYKTIIERAVHSPDIFQTIFLILSDIFHRSRYDDIIQFLIIYILDEVKCRCENNSLVDLYPFKLKNIVYFLENDPDDVSSLPFLYKHTLDLINELFLNQKTDFILLMSHYNKWFAHFIETKNLGNIYN